MQRDTLSAPFGFTWELYHGDQVYLRARWYAPGQGTFTSRDPFAGWRERPDSLHSYMYAGNNPIVWIDPSGQSWYLTVSQTADLSVQLGYFTNPSDFLVYGLELIGVPAGKVAEVGGKQVAQKILTFNWDKWVISHGDLPNALFRSMARPHLEAGMRHVANVLPKTLGKGTAAGFSATIGTVIAFSMEINTLKGIIDGYNSSGAGIGIGTKGDAIFIVNRATVSGSVPQAQAIIYPRYPILEWFTPGLYILDKLPASLAIGYYPVIGDPDWWHGWHFTRDEPNIPCQIPPDTPRPQPYPGVRYGLPLRPL